MDCSGVKFAARLMLTVSIYFAPLVAVEASPYTATYLGDSRDLSRSSTGYYNNQTGLSYDFESTTRPLTDSEAQNLPQVTVLQGGTYPIPVTYSMHTIAINNSGTVIGSVPAGSRLSDPWTVESMVYTVRSPDGHYSPLVELCPVDPRGGRGWLALSQTNQILIQDFQGARLLDLNSGTTTPLEDLVPQELRRLYRGFHADGIDDHGNILVSSYPTADANVPLWENSAFILAPPVPEPSALWIFGAVAMTLGVRTATGRGRKRLGRTQVA